MQSSNINVKALLILGNNGELVNQTMRTPLHILGINRNDEECSYKGWKLGGGRSHLWIIGFESDKTN